MKLKEQGSIETAQTCKSVVLSFEPPEGYFEISFLWVICSVWNLRFKTDIINQFLLKT